MKQFDFENDLKQELHNGLKPFGVRIPIKEKFSDMLLDYLTVWNKIVEPIPRTVKISPVLKKRRHKQEIENVINLLVSRLEQGKNINQFQSKKLIHTGFHDHLVNEWKIYHFHLSMKLKPKDFFVKQVDQLLFVYIDEKQAILLDTDIHKKGVFADTKWQEILHDHYPEVIKEYLHDAKDVFPKLNSTERQTMWNKGYTVPFTKIKDKVYYSLGGGRSVSGHSTMVTSQVNETIRWLHAINNEFKEMGSEICNFYSLNENDVKFKLIIGKRRLEIIDQKSKLMLLEYPLHINKDLII